MHLPVLYCCCVGTSFCWRRFTWWILEVENPVGLSSLNHQPGWCWVRHLQFFIIIFLLKFRKDYFLEHFAPSSPLTFFNSALVFNVSSLPPLFARYVWFHILFFLHAPNKICLSLLPWVSWSHQYSHAAHEKKLNRTSEHDSWHNSIKYDQVNSFFKSNVHWIY